MPRTTSPTPSPTLAALYADVPPPDVADRMPTPASLIASAATRADMAGAPINLMVHPRTYQQRVSRMWGAYATDPLFQFLIDRAVDFAANGFRWEVPAETEGQPWTERLKDRRALGRTEREEDFWAAWSAKVNERVPGVISGLHEIARWCARHLLLGGMFVPAWEIGEMAFGKQKFLVPTKITCYSPAQIALQRKRQLFAEERMFLRLPAGMKPMPLREGEQVEATPHVVFGDKVNNRDYQELPYIGMKFPVVAKDTEAMWIKFNWSPGDLVTIQQARHFMTGAGGLYPYPPFFSLLPQFVMRQKLIAADLAILDGIINYVLLWRCGDKDHPPKPPLRDSSGKVVEKGTIAQMQELIQAGRSGQAIELFLPYYVDLVIKMPDTSVLVNETKYVQSTLEILNRFGILFARTSAGSKERMERINITNFEEFLRGLRLHMASFFQVLAAHIVRINEKKLAAVPNWTPSPLNTKNDAFISQLVALGKLGKLSLQSLLQFHGLDPAVEIPRIAQELSLDVDDLTNANVPVSYVQRTGVPGKGTTTSIPPTRQTGRPKDLEAGRRQGQRQRKRKREE